MIGLRVSSYIHAFFIRIIRFFEPWMIRRFCVESYPYPQLCAYNTCPVLIFYLDMLFGSATESFTTFEKKVMKSEPQVFLWKWFLQKNVRVGRNSKQKPYVSYKNRDNFCFQPLSPSSMPPSKNNNPEPPPSTPPPTTTTPTPTNTKNTVTNTHIHTYTHTYLPTYLPTYIHKYIHTYLQTYIHTYIYIYRYT